MNNEQMRRQAFVEEYNALCRKYGMQILPVDQRQQVDGIWIIKNPSLDVQEISGWQPPIEQMSSQAEVLEKTSNGL